MMRSLCNYQLLKLSFPLVLRMITYVTMFNEFLGHKICAIEGETSLSYPYFVEWNIAQQFQTNSTINVPNQRCNNCIKN